MLMHAHRRAVDHLHIAVVSLSDRSQNAVPHSSLSPSDEAIVAGRARSKILRQRPPRRARSQPPEDTVQNSAVVDPRNPARLVRQQRRDHSPLEVSQLVAPHDTAPPVGKLESHLVLQGNPVYGFTT